MYSTCAQIHLIHLVHIHLVHIHLIYFHVFHLTCICIYGALPVIVYHDSSLYNDRCCGTLKIVRWVAMRNHAVLRGVPTCHIKGSAFLLRTRIFRKEGWGMIELQLECYDIWSVDAFVIWRGTAVEIFVSLENKNQ